MANRCRICNKISEGIFCDIHQKAYDNLREKYEIWKYATNLTWDEYILELLKNEYTGNAVKEVIEYIKSHQAD